jgi:hypothetical protein
MNAHRLRPVPYTGNTMTGAGKGRVVFAGPVDWALLPAKRRVRIYLPPSHARQRDRR